MNNYSSFETPSRSAPQPGIEDPQQYPRDIRPGSAPENIRGGPLTSVAGFATSPEVNNDVYAYPDPYINYPYPQSTLHESIGYQQSFLPSNYQFRGNLENYTAPGGSMGHNFQTLYHEYLPNSLVNMAPPPHPVPRNTTPLSVPNEYEYEMSLEPGYVAGTYPPNAQNFNFGYGIVPDIASSTLPARRTEPVAIPPPMPSTPAINNNEYGILAAGYQNSNIHSRMSVARSPSEGVPSNSTLFMQDGVTALSEEENNFVENVKRASYLDSGGLLSIASVMRGSHSIFDASSISSPAVSTYGTDMSDAHTAYGTPAISPNAPIEPSTGFDTELNDFAAQAFPDDPRLQVKLKNYMQPGEHELSELYPFVCKKRKLWGCSFSIEGGLCSHKPARRTKILEHIARDHLDGQVAGYRLPFLCDKSCGDIRCELRFPSRCSLQSHTRNLLIECEVCHQQTSEKNRRRHQKSSKCRRSGQSPV